MIKQLVTVLIGVVASSTALIPASNPGIVFLFYLVFAIFSIALAISLGAYAKKAKLVSGMVWFYLALTAGHGERSRSKLLFKLAATENVVSLAVNVLAVNVSFPHPLCLVPKSEKKCLTRCILSKSVSLISMYTSVFYTLSVLF